MINPFFHEALLQERLAGKVRCNNCERHCLLVSGGKGWCRTRRNRAGTLFTTTYGAISTVAVNPIEKKPLFHFHPGTLALTAGGWSCNFGCPWCQNWQITKKVPNHLEYTSPQDFVITALSSACAGTSISFNEPTLTLEWSLDMFRLARDQGLYNTFVTNGYMTPQALTLLAEAGLDALNVDIKGDYAGVKTNCQGIDVEKVWSTCRLARHYNLHLEITTLVIPGVNDSPKVLYEIAARIAAELGADVPWHVSAYQRAYLFKALATSAETLQWAYTIGKSAGLQFVYTGNLPGSPLENTYCPHCDALVIRREHDAVQNLVLQHGRCWRCGESIPGVW
jgi:pyruvate formate lyase activating enzyme